MADSMSVDALRALLPIDGEIAAQVQIFALKQLQQVQKDTTLALISSSQTVSASPSLPHLGSRIDISV